MRRAAWVGAIALLAVACSSSEGGGPPAVGRPIPDFAAVDLAGDTVSLSSLRGTPYLLNLWATWCTPCRKETPFLQSLYEKKRGEGFRIVGVSMDSGDAEDQVRDFIEEFGVTYTMLLDPQMRAMDRFNVLGLPASFLVDREGFLRWMRFGPVSESDAEFGKALEEILR